MAAQAQAHFGSDAAAPLAAWLLRLEQLRYAPQVPGGAGSASTAAQLRALRRDGRRLPWPAAQRGADPSAPLPRASPAPPLPPSAGTGAAQ